MNQDEISSIREQIREMEDTARRVFADSADFPAVNRNMKRILASIAMLNVNLEEIE